MPKKKKAAIVISPKGKGPKKRTPTSVFDTVGQHDDVFQGEKIMGKRLAMVHFVALPREVMMKQDNLKFT
jgi:hypothetical protein